MTLRPTENGHVCDGTLMAFLDEELKAAQRAAVGRHVHACRACGERLARLRTALTSCLGRSQPCTTIRSCQQTPSPYP